MPMYTISQAFDNMQTRMQLTPTQQEYVAKQHDALRTELQKLLSDIAYTFLTGSYARDTAVRPVHDVDIFACIPCSLGTPNAVETKELIDTLMKRFCAALRAIYPTSKEPRIQNHSVGIELSTVSFDVVPALYVGSYPKIPYYFIPSTKTGEWIRSNPNVHQSKGTEANERLNNKLKPLIKIAKVWKNERKKLSEKYPLKSFHLELMCYDFDGDVNNKSYQSLMMNLFQFLIEKIDQRCIDPVSGNDINVLTPDERTLVKKDLVDARDSANAALYLEKTDNILNAHNKWKQLFGSMYVIYYRQDIQ